MSETGTATPGMRVARASRRKEKDDHDHEHHGEDQGAFHIDDRGADGGGAVEHHGHVDAQRDGSLDRVELAPDAVHGGDDVGPRLAEDDDGDGALVVEVAGGADVLHGVGDIGHVGEPDGRAVLVADDQRPEVRRVRELAVADDVRRDDAVGDLPLGQVGVLQAQHGLHVRHAQAVTGELRGVHVHAHRRQRAAARRHLADALDLRELLLDDGRRLVVQLGRVVLLRGQAEDHDRRIRRVDLAVRRVAGQVGRQVGARGVDGGLHVARRAVDVPGEIELDGDARGAERTLRGHLRDARDVAELPLQGRGDRRGHDLGAGPGQGRADRNGREIDLRQGRDGQRPVGDGSGQRNPHRDQGRRHRPANERSGEVHAGVGCSGWPAGAGGPEGCTASFSRGAAAGFTRETLGKVVEEDVDDRRGVQREHLAEEQAAHHRDAQRPAQLRAEAGAEGQRDAPRTGRPSSSS